MHGLHLVQQGGFGARDACLGRFQGRVGGEGKDGLWVRVVPLQTLFPAPGELAFDQNLALLVRQSVGHLARVAGHASHVQAEHAGFACRDILCGIHAFWIAQPLHTGFAANPATMCFGSSDLPLELRTRAVDGRGAAQTSRHSRRIVVHHDGAGSQIQPQPAYLQWIAPLQDGLHVPHLAIMGFGPQLRPGNLQLDRPFPIGGLGCGLEAMLFCTSGEF